MKGFVIFNVSHLAGGWEDLTYQSQREENSKFKIQLVHNNQAAVNLIPIFMLVIQVNFSVSLWLTHSRR